MKITIQPLFLTILLGLGILFSPPIYGLDFKKVSNTKKATALVVDPKSNDAIGTAFCINKAGYFITNEHVIDKLEKKVWLILEPGTDNEKKFDALIVRSDRKLDLAILKTEETKNDDYKFSVIPLGSDKKMFETQELTAFGYPFGKALATNKDSFPGISVNVGKVTALRRSKGKLNEIQIDAVVNPGNSGGPLINEKGEVVAVVQKGVMLTGINFAIPITKLNEFLSLPLVTVKYNEKVAWGNRYSSQEINIVVDALPGSVKPDKVEVKFKEDGSSKVILATKNRDMNFTAKIPLLIEKKTSAIKASIHYDEVKLSCRLIADSFEVDDNRIKFEEVKMITAGGKKAYLINGDSVDIKDDSLNLIALIGGKQFRLPVKSLTKIFFMADEVIKTVPFSVTVSSKGSVLFSDKLQFRVAEMPIKNIAARASEENIFNESEYEKFGQTEFKLPSVISDVVKGRNGRYLFLRLNKLKKVAVLDVASRKVISYIPLPDIDCFIAAGKSKFVILQPSLNLLHLWDLNTLKKESEKRLPFIGMIKGACMGAGTDGPLLLRVGVGTRTLDNCKYVFLDVNSASLLDYKVDESFRTGISSREKSYMRASIDGSVFSFWDSTGSPSGVEVASLVDGIFYPTYEHTTGGYVLPGPRGDYIYTQRAGLFDFNLKNLSKSPRLLLPTTVPSYYIGVRDSSTTKINELHLYTHGRTEPLAEFPHISGLDFTYDKSSRSVFSPDKLIHYIPQLNTLVVIPATKDKVDFYDVKMTDLLNKTGDYLFVDSLPTFKVGTGSEYFYNVSVKSSSGGVKYALESGPEGMSVSESGVVTWNVPSEISGKTSVILKISDASDNNIYHSFIIKTS